MWQIELELGGREAALAVSRQVFVERVERQLQSLYALRATFQQHASSEASKGLSLANAALCTPVVGRGMGPGEEVDDFVGLQPRLHAFFFVRRSVVSCKNQRE